jgi:hypothetical protein
MAADKGPALPRSPRSSVAVTAEIFPNRVIGFACRSCITSMEAEITPEMKQN